MHFSTVLVAISAVFQTAVAVVPGNNALQAGLNDGVELALYDQLGPVAFDSATKAGCPVNECLLPVVTKIPCIVACVVKKDIPCILKCVSPSDLCPCLSCLPDAVYKYIMTTGICSADLKAELFSKVYLGVASDEEKNQAQAEGYDIKLIHESDK